MYVEKIMTRDVVSVGAATKLTRLASVMQERKLRHLPVVDDENRLLGIISHRDVQRAEPSPITTLDRGEANYLLSKITADKIMHRDVITCSPDTLVEEAGCLMRTDKIGCLPVVRDGRLVGILTSVDLLDFFLDITGCLTRDAARIAVHLPDEAGRLAGLLGAINQGGGYISTVVSPQHADGSGMRVAIVRFRAADPAALTRELRAAGYDVFSETMPD